MVVEPLGSVMTIQSQPVQKQAEGKPEQEKTDVSAAEKAVNPDAATLSVAKTEQKEGAKEEPDNQTKDPSKELISEQVQASNEKLKKAVEQLNRNMPHSEAVFGFHEKTNRVTIKIVDKDTKEIIREFPPEQTLDMIAKVWELAGILVDEKR